MKKELLIIFLLAFLLSGCANKESVNTGDQNKPETANNTPSSNIPDVPKNDTSKVNNQDNEYAEWKSYSDSKYGINFKYPTDWNCKVDADQTPSLKAAARIISCIQTSRNKLGTVPSININIMTVYDKMSPIDWLVKYYRIPEGTPKELNYDIAGVKGIKFIYTEGNKEFDPELNEGITAAFIKNDKLFHIYCHVDSKGEQKNNIENILKSIAVD